MRRAVLMEDEGREMVATSFEDRKSAEDWIAQQAGEYFKPEDYYILSGER
jgi:hypothetical protein